MSEQQAELMKKLVGDLSEDDAWCGDMTPPRSKLQVAQARFAAVREEKRRQEEERWKEEEDRINKLTGGTDEVKSAFLLQKEQDELDEILSKQEPDDILKHPLGHGSEFRPFRVKKKKAIRGVRVMWMNETGETYVNDTPHFFNSEYARQ
jgi:hypothetical protein